MTHELPFPTSPRRVLLHMRNFGTGTRSVDMNGSDRVDLEYPDPLDLKGERSALASIFSTRAYIWAKKSIKAQEFTLKQPPSVSIHSMEEFQSKFENIGLAFIIAMSKGISRDERKISQLPDSDPTKKNFRRFEDLLRPAIEYGLPGDHIVYSRFGLKRIFNRENVAFNDLFGGVEPLPAHIHILIQHAYEHYHKKFGRKPSTSTVVQIIRNSYDSYVKVNTNRHALELNSLTKLELASIEKESDSDVTELRGDTEETFHIAFKPEIEKEVSTQRQEQERDLSRKSTCAFTMPTSYTKDFLDPETLVDFEDPMKDAFDLLVDLLAA